MKDSIEELTLSLQELEASRNKKGYADTIRLPEVLSPRDLHLSPEVESFVEQNIEYAARNRAVSVGEY